MVYAAAATSSKTFLKLADKSLASFSIHPIPKHFEMSKNLKSINAVAHIVIELERKI